jgi:nitric oxide reductase subunit B
MNRRLWWQVLLAVLVFGAAGTVFVGVRTYQDAPPIVDFLDTAGHTVQTRAQVLRGQSAFQRTALMEYGSFFGDGGGRGPDFTAEALHLMATRMTAFHQAAGLPADGIPTLVAREIKDQPRDAQGRVVLHPAQVAALADLNAHYLQAFRGQGPEAFQLGPLVRDAASIQDLTAFFFWGAWVCGARRPGGTASYTHDWPYDPSAGNVPGASILVWSVVALLALAIGVGVVLYLWGRAGAGARAVPTGRLLTQSRVAAFQPTPTQRAAGGFFAIAAVLLLVQVLAGVLVIHDFVGLVRWFGIDQTEVLPIVIPRSWHVQLALLWIATCWIGASIFLLPTATAGEEPRGQLRLVRILLGLLVLSTVGGVVGMTLGPLGILGKHWRLLGHQGWEFVEPGRLWQAVLQIALGLWAVIVARGVRPALRAARATFTLPHWLTWTTTSVAVLFLSGFVAGPETSFPIADFWRWCVVHLWAEAFFEVFTTIIVAWLLVDMGLSSRAAASRAVYGATLLFLGSGLLGMSHNFYWNAKPEATIAIGAVFSTLQVVPLLLLAADAWALRRLPNRAARAAGHPARAFGAGEAFAFLLAVSFWNVVGAGVFGLVLNLPIVNYYEHGTYLTVNHGHAALMGVYGNLSIAVLLYCMRHLVPARQWQPGLARLAFWSINVGLALMVTLDLLPAGLLQLQTALEQGLWYARSQTFVQGAPFQTLTWLRVVGGALFVVGGVVPLTWLAVTGWWARKPAIVRSAAVLAGEPDAADEADVTQDAAARDRPAA